MSTAWKNIFIETLHSFPIQRAAVFGSFARAEQNSDSDIDILIETESGFTLFDMLRMERILEEKLQRKIDLVEFSALKPSIRSKVLSQAIPLIWANATPPFTCSTF